MFNFSQIPDGPPIAEGYVDLTYGTAGFRGNAESPPNNMDHIAYRCGLLFPSFPFIFDEFYQKYSNCIYDYDLLGLGIMVTASHNLYHDNGIKLFAPSGHILESVWEPMLTSFVNTRKPIQQELSELFEKNEYKDRDLNINVLIGWDTRPSCDALVSKLQNGIREMFDLLNLNNSRVILLGMITSPTISYLLSSRNFRPYDDEPYISFVYESFSRLLQDFINLGLVDTTSLSERQEELYFDGAFGVGGYKIIRFFDLFRRIGITPILRNFHKDGTPQDLNNKCGACYLYSTSFFPEALKEQYESYRNKRFCCFDGDVDRVLYYMPVDKEKTQEGEYKVILINGDRLLIVMMMLLWLFLRRTRRFLKVGVFQTRFCNSASIRYIRTLLDKYNSKNPRVSWHHEFFKIGCKHADQLSHKYDISVYYETNGHGNIIFNSTKFYKNTAHAGADSGSQQVMYTEPGADKGSFKSPCKGSTSDRNESGGYGYDQEIPEEVFVRFLEVFYPSGDAILNCLILELAFIVLKLNFNDVANFYQDLPLTHIKYNLPEELKTFFASSPHNDALLLKPEGFQTLIDRKVKDCRASRAFLRPSGTEPALRVFVEAESEGIIKEVNEYIFSMIDEFLSTKRDQSLALL